MADSSLPKHPLAEIFGYKYDDQSAEAVEHRDKRLCPFHPDRPICNKASKTNPIGVCTIYDRQTQDCAIICPSRFREHSIIIRDAASFFFPEGARFKAISEVRLKDASGESAGNIDVVVVSLDDQERITDFGALEIQSVYISGNIRMPFEAYIKDPASRQDMDWTRQPKFPRPDYLSSSRKRLLPQLLYKGKILQVWGKKLAVAVHKGFFATLPELPVAERQNSDIAWMAYDLFFVREECRYELRLLKIVYTRFDPALNAIMSSSAGSVDRFRESLQSKLNRNSH